jgi:proteasome lid subunit RPN8/RPN11
MIVKTSMKGSIIVSIRRELLQTILKGARTLHPRETVMLLRGKKKKNLIEITELVVPPLAHYGYGFTNLPLHMLPMDFSIVGTAHSHPSGNTDPSQADLNHFFGRIMMIVGFPFVDETNVAVYDRDGEEVSIVVAK